MSQFILPFQIAAGLLLSLLACVIVYQFGLWFDRMRKDWEYRREGSLREERRQYERVTQLLECIAERVGKK